MNREDFSRDAPGRLVETTHGAIAFVPDPLPRRLSLTTESILALSGAESALGRLSATSGRAFNPYLIGSPLLRREAILSSRIEGTYTTPEELALFEMTDETGDLPGKADTHDVFNYVRAMERGLSLLGELPVSLRMLREIHSVLMQSVRGGAETPGEFRRHQNYIGGGRGILEARFVPPPVEEMHRGLAELERYIHTSPADAGAPLLIQIALIHYQFETVHPFRDGNGRVGRLLIPLLLCSAGRLDSPLLYMSAYFDRHRDEYVDLLLHVSQKGDWDSWIRFFLAGVEEAATEAISQATELLDLRRTYHGKFLKGQSSALLVRLIDALFHTPTITIAKAARLLNVSDQAAANNLTRLEKEGVVREITGRKRNKIYAAESILSFFGE